MGLTLLMMNLALQLALMVCNLTNLMILIFSCQTVLLLILEIWDWLLRRGV